MKKFSFTKVLALTVVVGGAGITLLGLTNSSNLLTNSLSGLLSLNQGAPSMGAPYLGAPDGSPPPVSNDQGGNTTNTVTPPSLSDSYASLPTTPTYKPRTDDGAMQMTANNKAYSIAVKSGTDVQIRWYQISDYSYVPVSGPCTTSWGQASVGTSGSQTFKAVTATTTYSLYCGNTATGVTVIVLPADAPALTITALANDTAGLANVPYYSNVKISVTTNDAQRISICNMSYPDPGGRTLSSFSTGSLPSDFRFPNVVENKGFNITCTSFSGEQATSHLDVHVNPDTSEKLKVTLTANGVVGLYKVPYDPKNIWPPPRIDFMHPQLTEVTMVWTSNHPDAVCYSTGGPGNGSWEGAPAQTGSGTRVAKLNTWYGGEYTIRCTYQAQEAQASVTIGFEQPPAVTYAVHLSANGSEGTITVASGTNVLIAWYPNYPKSWGGSGLGEGSLVCDASGNWGGRKNIYGGQEFTGPLYTNQSYTLNCHDVNDPAVDAQGTVTVYVGGAGPITNNINATGTNADGTPCEIANPNDGKLHVASKLCKPTNITTTTTTTTTTTKTLPPANYEDQVLANFDANQNPFNDTSIADICGKAAVELYRRAVVGGFADGSFRNSDLVNRAQAAKFLLLASSYATVVSGSSNTVSSTFRDVMKGQWYTNFVVKAAQFGIINGYSDHTFRPANTVNTAEFLKMLTLTFNLPANLPYDYTDVNSTDWFAQYAGIAQKYDLFPADVKFCTGADASTSNSSTLLNPGKQLTRADVAVAIYQYLKNR